MAEAAERVHASVSHVTAAEVQRFEAAARIRDRAAFAAELDALIDEKLAAATGRAGEPSLDEVLAGKARALQADVRWTPSATDLQRGRRALLEAFERPHNLPLPAFARLAHKSRQQLYKDLAARRLLSLNVGPRRQRLPDWQLDPLGLRLTRAVLAAAPEVDAWTVYRALSEPLDALAGRVPVETVNPGNLDAVVGAVLGVLGLPGETGH
jgi:hypothetical protein